MKGLLIIYFIIMNCWGFLIMKEDKALAIARQWRISENKIMTIAFFGGAIGVGTGMIVCWHKVRKPKFYIFTPLLSLFHIYIIKKLIKRRTL